MDSKRNRQETHIALQSQAAIRRCQTRHDIADLQLREVAVKSARVELGDVHVHGTHDAPEFEDVRQAGTSDVVLACLAHTWEFYPLLRIFDIPSGFVADNLNPQWERHFEGIADELLRLAIACDVRLREPGVIDRVLRNDASVCGKRNEDSFRRMRKLLTAYYDSIGKAVDRIGPEETKKIIDIITEHKKQLRDSGGR